MKEKYYTPTIEEFHVGFECESYITTSKGPNDIKSEWQKIIFGSLLNQYECLVMGELLHKQEIDVAKFRVKYLDKEDIESLGFKFDKTSTNSQWKFFKNNLFLFYRPSTKELGTFTIDPSKNEFMLKYNRDNKMVSFLIIKNKSELKRLLKQLNID